ncbi:MAG TPA: hypothetical protein VKS22_07550 [Candidatus Binataceae bacterium]|nr:hypothetical protein [Candidatus Binataceae bacterium]
MAEKRTPQTEAILRITHANVHLARGVAHAAAIGFENFARRLAHENVLSPDLTSNGFVAGAVAGWAAALQEGASLAEQAFKIWMGASTADPSPTPRAKPRKSPRKRAG